MLLTRRFAFRLFLAVVLLVSQQQAVLHMLTHGFEQLEQQTDKSLPHDQACAKCLAFAQLDHLAASTTATLQRPPYVDARPQAAALADFSRAPLAAYLSRAPPGLS